MISRFLFFVLATAALPIYSLDQCTEEESQQSTCGVANVAVERCRLDLFADVLFWAASESGSENWAQIFTSAGSVETIDVLSVDFGWDPGVRIGLDYAMNYDGWNMEGIYTWYRTQGSSQASSGNISSSFLGAFYINNADGAKDSGAQYQEASMKWTISLNLLDWQLGRKYWVSSALSLRPFLGLKGGWIEQVIDSAWKGPIGVANFTSGTETIHNNFAGVGPSVGLDTQWQLGSIRCHAFSFFADFSGAILWGHWTFKDVYQNNAPQMVSVALPSFNNGASMLRSLAGIEWRSSFFALRAGYEAQFWLDQLRFYSFNAGRLNSLLAFQGGSIDVSFSF